MKAQTSYSTMKKVLNEKPFLRRASLKKRLANAVWGALVVVLVLSMVGSLGSLAMILLLLAADLLS